MSAGSAIDIKIAPQPTPGVAATTGYEQLGYEKPDTIALTTNKSLTDELKNGFHNDDYIVDKEAAGGTPISWTIGRYDTYLEAILRNVFDGGTPNVLTAVNDNTATSDVFTLVKSFTDIGEHHVLLDTRVSSIELAFTAGEKIGGTINWAADGFERSTTDIAAGATPAAAAIVQSGGMGVGTVYIDGGVPVGCVTGINLTVDAGLNGDPCLGGKGHSKKRQGVLTVNGTVRLSFNNDALFALAREKEYLALAWDIEEDAITESWTLPKISVTGYPESGDNTSQNYIELSFNALFDDATGTILTIERA